MLCPLSNSPTISCSNEEPHLKLKFLSDRNVNVVTHKVECQDCGNITTRFATNWICSYNLVPVCHKVVTGKGSVWGGGFE